jgi:hypothetical protein
VGGYADDEIPLLVMLFYLFRDVEFRRESVWFWCQAVIERRSTRETTSGGEFGWGGTSVKQ